MESGQSGAASMARICALMASSTSLARVSSRGRDLDEPILVPARAVEIDDEAVTPEVVLRTWHPTCAVGPGVSITMALAPILAVRATRLNDGGSATPRGRCSRHRPAFDWILPQASQGRASSVRRGTGRIDHDGAGADPRSARNGIERWRCFGLTCAKALTSDGGTRLRSSVKLRPLAGVETVARQRRTSGRDEHRQNDLRQSEHVAIAVEILPSFGSPEP